MDSGGDGHFLTVDRIVLRALDHHVRAAAVRAYRLHRQEHPWIHTAWHLEHLATRLEGEGRDGQAALVRRLSRISHRNGRSE